MIFENARVWHGRTKRKIGVRKTSSTLSRHAYPFSCAYATLKRVDSTSTIHVLSPLRFNACTYKLHLHTLSFYPYH